MDRLPGLARPCPRPSDAASQDFSFALPCSGRANERPTNEFLKRHLSNGLKPEVKLRFHSFLLFFFLDPLPMLPLLTFALPRGAVN